MKNSTKAMSSTWSPLFAAVSAAMVSLGAIAQDSEPALEEVIVVGSQIKGASISEALAVSVVEPVDRAHLATVDRLVGTDRQVVVYGEDFVCKAHCTGSGDQFVDAGIVPKIIGPGALQSLL